MIEMINYEERFRLTNVFLENNGIIKELEME